MKSAFSGFSRIGEQLASEPRVQQARDWYRHQSARDQLIVRAVAVLLLLAVIFSLFFAPLIRQHQALTTELNRQQSFYQLMLDNASRFGGKAAAASGDSKTLLASVGNLARVSQVRMTRYEQDGDSLRVWLDNVSFDDTMSWIEALAQRHGIQVSQINIDQTDNTGIVNVRVTFVQG
ncbi:MAG: hypothetical protein CMI00_08910 [Oceanospirillaceae bacterium]|nr:hypothetical protein [Oceanospirillaceae bacterium]|tara:strand:+ start:1421 stop:1951 length:531 start_codon:yes stop_codon:yes gene_type:complete